MSETFLRRKMDLVDERTLFPWGLPDRVPLYTDDEACRHTLEDGYGMPRVLRGTFAVERIPSSYALKFIAPSDYRAAREHVLRFREAMWSALEAMSCDLVDALNEANVAPVSLIWDRGTHRGAHDPRVCAPTCGVFAWRGDRTSRAHAFVHAVLQGRIPPAFLDREGLGHLRAAMTAAGWRNSMAVPEVRRAALEAAQVALARTLGTCDPASPRSRAGPLSFALQPR